MKMTHAFRLVITMTALAGLNALAEAPEGYYSSCEGKKGASLLSALCDKIKSHTNVGYDGLWKVYRSSDIRKNGKVWDMYSTKEWTVGAQHCGNYSYVGDCINREHSMPKSWFKKASPMASDAFHVYPTDGKVNGQRSNFPYGKCSGGTTLPSHNSVKALGRLGSSTFPGYSGTVFEPADEYKGDFARTYFYMAACYNDRISGWTSDMLAGNSYPAFAGWAIDLLLKWHRQDPVSDKELDRNDAVYSHQHNRNPFIDHPDLAEHIWGNRTDTPWEEEGTPQPMLATPLDGSSINLGPAGTGVPRTTTVIVMGRNLTSDLSASVSGTGFSLSATTIPASSACTSSGFPLSITFSSGTPVEATGTLTIKSGEVQAKVSLSASAVDGIPALTAGEVGETSFDARWINVGAQNDIYTLNVLNGSTSVSGYPAKVAASAERHTVSGLTPGTTYIYYIEASSGIRSNEISVTTSLPVPSIQFLADCELFFTAAPGTPSATAELIIDAENIDAPIMLTVDPPFQLSTDKTTWSTSLQMPDEADRFYLRMNGTEEGTFTSTVTASAGSYETDDLTIEGVISSTPTFHEDFEKASSLASYNGGYYEGSASAWLFTNALVGSDPRDRHTGAQGARLHKTSGTTSRIEMAEPKEHGIGTVTFHAKAWAGEGGDLSLDISTDGGITWTPVRTFTVTDNGWNECTASVNIPGEARLRIDRISGKRISIDDISISDYAVSSVADLDYHAWDAYCVAGTLVIDNTSEAPIKIEVYSPNGATWHSGTIATGSHALSLPCGLYLVSSSGFTRRVVVR